MTKELPSLDAAKALVRPGRYRHFKGALYDVIGVGYDSETLQTMVIYRAVNTSAEYWVRPLMMFIEKIVAVADLPGQPLRTVFRFTRLPEEQQP